MTRVLLVRHGNSAANQIGFWGGQVDVDLTPVGVAQAEKAAKYITDAYSVDALYASTLKRAWRTAEAIGKIIHKPVTKDKRLCEICGGIWEGMRYEEIKDRFPQEFELWNRDMGKIYPPGGESVSEVQKRSFAALKEICEANVGKTVVVVTHRVVLRTLQCLWENRPINQINECEWTKNCSVTELEYDNGTLIPIMVNQADFMGNMATEVNSIM